MTKIFYIRVNGNEDRDFLHDTLDAEGFEFIDMREEEISYKPKGDFEEFKELVEHTCDFFGIYLIECLHCENAGLF